MPNVFKNVIYTVTTTMADTYTCPAGTTAIIIGAQAANIIASTVAFSAKVVVGANNVHLANAIAIPTNAALGFISGKLVLEANSKLQANTNSNANVQLTLSILEIS